MALVKCNICLSKTKDIPSFQDTNGNDIYVCEVCDGKYGFKLKDKIESLGFEIAEEKSTEIVEPFECTLEYKGGTKQDIINLISGLMNTEDISIDELEKGMF